MQSSRISAESVASILTASIPEVASGKLTLSSQTTDIPSQEKKFGPTDLMCLYLVLTRRWSGDHERDGTRHPILQAAFFTSHYDLARIITLKNGTTDDLRESLYTCNISLNCRGFQCWSINMC